MTKECHQWKRRLRQIHTGQLRELRWAFDPRGKVYAQLDGGRDDLLRRGSNGLALRAKLGVYPMMSLRAYRRQSRRGFRRSAV